MAVTSTEQERYCPWLAMMGAAAVQLDADLIASKVREDILIQERFEPDATPIPRRTVDLGLIRVSGAYRTMHPTGVALSLKLRPGRRHFRGSEIGHWIVSVAHHQELGGEMVVSTNKACEFELDTTKTVWTQFLDVFQSEEFVSELESQTLELIQRIGRTRMEWEVDQWL